MSGVLVPSNPNITPQEVVQQLRAIRAQIRDFVLMPPSESLPLTRAASIDIAQIHSAIDAIAASPNLRNGLGRDADELRAETKDDGEWSQVLVEIDTFRRGVAGGIRVRRHRLGTIALRVYQVSRQLALDKEHAELLPHVDAMRRALKVGKRRPQTPQPDAQPAPTPAPADQLPALKKQ